MVVAVVDIPSKQNYIRYSFCDFKTDQKTNMYEHG